MSHRIDSDDHGRRLPTPWRLLDRAIIVDHADCRLPMNVAETNPIVCGHQLEDSIPTRLSLSCMKLHGTQRIEYQEFP
jgi:hypothetical protein